jgi:hypothetical protein
MAAVENPKILIDALEELDSLVEMFEVKRAIVQQVGFLLVVAFNSMIDKKPGNRFENHKLHAVFYGPPGVGKSRTARCVARIWQGIGILSELQKRTLAKETTAVETPTPTEGDSVEIASVAKAVRKIQNVRNGVLELYESYKPVVRASTTPPKSKIFSRPTVAHTLEDAWKTTTGHWESVKGEVQEAETELINAIRTATAIRTPTPDVKPVELPPIASTPEQIIVCGREDFTAEYSGQSDKKALKFLQANRGRCLIIEEAYLLHLGENDNYGMEAITILNRFMDEHAEEIIIIMAGYKELMEKNIFAHQHGLQRRFQWVFEVNGYTPVGLSEIFRRQLEFYGWSLSAEVDLKAFFEANIANFEAFGGDTENLAFKCKLIYGGIAFKNMFETLLLDAGSNLAKTPQVITPAMLETAYREYLVHKVATRKKK